jgi:2-hydroxy-3-oxopropionate reductase
MPLDLYGPEAPGDRLMPEMIGFVGLGQMGKPMSENLLKAGYSLTVCDVNPVPVEDLVRKGAQRATSPIEVAGASKVIISMLPSSPDVEAVVLGNNGILKSFKKGSIFIDMSTILPSVSRKLSRDIEAHGGEMLDAPVSRGQAAAIQGTLSIMVGGKKEIFEQCKPIFQKMGTDIYYCGPAGSGGTVKLVNNLILGILFPALGEALMMGVKSGIPLETILDVLYGSSSDNFILRNFLPKTLFKGNLTPGFRVEQMLKDVHLAMDTTRELGIPAFLGATACQILQEGVAANKGKMDVSGIITLLEEHCGVQLRTRT